LLIAVVPSAWKSVPLVIPLMRKCVTSVLSTAARSSTIRPDWVSSTVVMSATTGVSPTGVTVMVDVATSLWAATEEPSSDASRPKLPARLVCRSGVKRRPAWPSA